MRNVDAAGLGIGDDYPPRIMGVVNLSTESPYEPSVFDDPADAATFIDTELIDEGADIIDVGLESANKRFDVLPPEAELERLDDAVDAIASVSGEAVFSIETRYHEVADAALSRGFEAVNDICGFADPEMPRVCAAHDVPVVKMASPPDLTRPGAVGAGGERPDAKADGETYVDALYDALAREGFTEKTIVDPAFGGWSETKTLADDRETFRRLREFRGYGRPVLVSLNRKNFLREVVGRSTEGALPVSLAATALAVERGVHVIRTHDVAETRDAAAIGDTFTDGGLVDEEIGLRELGCRTPAEVSRHADRLGVDRTIAGDAVARVFEIATLTPAERDTLTTAAHDHGVHFAWGTDGGILAGTQAELDRLAGADLEGRLSTLSAALADPP